MRKILTPVAVAAAIAVPAFAHQEGSGEARVKKERVICKSPHRVGTRLSREQTCLTRSEWDAVAMTSRRATEEFVSRTQGQSGVGEAGKGVSPHGGGSPD